MGSVNIEIIVRKRPGGTSVDRVSERLADLKAWFKSARTIAREAIQDEFFRGAWRAPSGGSRPWAQHFQGYDQYFTHPQLIVTGSYLDAWMGRGGGSIEREDDRSFTIGVSGFPAAKIHRGGDSATTSRERVTEIHVTPKMRWYLGLVLGMWLKKTTTVIRIPSRPHATPDLQTREAMRNALRDHLTGAAAGFAERQVARAA